MEAVFDSSSLILIAKAAIIRPVSGAFAMVIPEAVREECTAKDSFDSQLISALIAEGRITVQNIVKQDTVDRFRGDFRLGNGEAEALALAAAKRVPLAVDDLPAIKACKILNLKFVTAIHFLIALTERKILTRQASMAKLEKLSHYGRYNRKILDDARRRIEGGE